MPPHHPCCRIRFLMTLALAIGSPCAPALPRPAPPPPNPGGPVGPPDHGGPLPTGTRPAPYKPVAVTLPQPYNDPSFEAFRKELGEIASHKDRAALAGKVVDKGFFWNGEKGDMASKRKSGIDNLAAAIGLDSQDGDGWETLAAAADDATLAPIPAKKGVLCSSAGPVYDQNAAEQTAKSTGTSPKDWGFPVKGSLDVHVADQPGSPVIEKVGSILVRILPEGPLPGAGDAPLPEPGSYLVRIVTPAGRLGYVADDTISALDSDRLCFVKDAGGWKITGYVDN